MFHFNEPVHQIGCAFGMVPRTLLKVSPYQRDKSSNLVTKLVPSVGEGFVIPVLVVEVDGLFEVIDGQHRLESLDKHCSGNYEVPCIIVPLKFRDLFLMFNIEKSDNIKDKATKIYSFYIQQLKNGTPATEQDLAKVFVYQSYAISIAFAYKEFDLASPSLVESAVKKFDNKDFLRDALDEAVTVRRHRGKRIKALEQRVLEICADVGVTDFSLRKSIITISTGNLWGRKRNILEDFDSGMDKLLEQIGESAQRSWLAGRSGGGYVPEEEE